MQRTLQRLPAVALLGVFVRYGLAAIAWIRRRDLVVSTSELLETAIALSDEMAGRLRDLSGPVDEVRTRADRLVEASPVDHAAAIDLATAIDDVAAGPYVALRTAHAALRECAGAAQESLQAIRRAFPQVAVPSEAVEHIDTIDAGLAQIDASVARLAQAGASGLAQPGGAARVSERAAWILEVLDAIGQLVADAGTRMRAGNDRLTEADRAITGRIVVVAGLGTILGLFFAGLNVLLFVWSRRWSREAASSRSRKPLPESI